MEKRENHFPETDARVRKTRCFFRLFMKFSLDVRTEEAAENALDFDPRGMHADRFQRCV